MELNTRAKGIMDLARKYSNEHHVSTMGSEYLILAMYDTEDSLCHFLFGEYEIEREEIVEKTEEIFILRKKDGEYNKSLETILNQASLIAGNKSVSEEHLFMSILMNKNTIAQAILQSLGLDIDDLIEDVKEIYDFDSNSTDELSFIRNITKLAKNNELASFIERDGYLKKMDIIMNRRYKNNPLLIGNAGVGKTALVEGYAMKLLRDEVDLTILSLNLTAMLAGTRYRGDFEERFNKFITEIACRKNVAIFIDEIHTIMGAATTEGNLDVANMLKPFLARNDIKVIGATTLDEYHKTIENDKALQRRFQPIFIKEPSLEETKKIIFGIREDYESFHNVKISDENLNYLVEQSDKRIVRKFRPDKCIDILDDCLSYNHIIKKDTVSIYDIDKAIDGFNGNDLKIDNVYSFKEINKYKWLYDMDLLNQSPLVKINYNGNSDGLRLLSDDFMNMFNIGFEALLEIDLNGFKDGFMLQTLIGAPPGYVGYQDEGILSKHILQYPMSIVVFQGFDKACGNVKSFILNMLYKGKFVDQRGRDISLSNTIVIIEGLSNKKGVGFNSKKEYDNFFDEYIMYETNLGSLNKIYEKALMKYDYEVSFDFNISNENKRSVNNYLFNKLNKKEKGKYIIKKEEIEIS
ncbi:MAG: ATP-dependent Clp protease ATP-binding subunit [Erysipelotrichaceae bacterium]|nr:ATP-dependent Clp protease ATP-binding subunit [Erysipelotrichaceae bacterium]